MSEVSDSLLEVEAALEELEQLEGTWEMHKPGVPGWMSQELTFGQLRLISLLDSHGPAPMTRIAEWLGVGLPAVSGIVDRVEKHGLVVRQHRHDDRRIVECSLTDEGRRLIGEITGMRRNVLRQTLGVLTEAELADLVRLLRIVLERTKASANPELSPSASPGRPAYNAVTVGNRPPVET